MKNYLTNLGLTGLLLFSGVFLTSCEKDVINEVTPESNQIETIELDSKNNGTLAQFIDENSPIGRAIRAFINTPRNRPNQRQTRGNRAIRLLEERRSEFRNDVTSARNVIVRSNENQRLIDNELVRLDLRLRNLLQFPNLNAALIARVRGQIAEQENRSLVEQSSRENARNLIDVKENAIGRINGAIRAIRAQIRF